MTSVTTDPRHVILEPVVSEKAYNLIQFDKYTFKVHPTAHKTQVRQAIELLFGVHVVAVKIVNVPGKPKRRGQTSGFRPGLQEGDHPAARRRFDRALRGGALMGVRQFKPTSPGRRFMTISDFDEVTRDKPEKSLLAPVKRHGGRNNTGPHHDAPPGRRPQAPLPHHRLQAAQGRRSGDRGVDRVRPQPLGAHRAAALRRRPQGLHPGAGPARRRGDRAVRRRRRHQGRQLPAAVVDPDRHDRARRRAAAGSGRAHGALGRRERAARRPRGRPRAPAPALRRAAPRPRDLPRDDRHRLQRDASEPVERQGRALALAGQAPARCAARP